MHRNNVSEIREEFARLLAEKEFTSVNREGSMTSLVGSSTIEISSASFLADQDVIFGEVNWDYVRREEEWYNSLSLSVHDFPGGAPSIWNAVADKDGFINSNYGWMIYSEENGFQYQHVVAELKKNPESRRAQMIYNTPLMWNRYNENGKNDFCCTDAVQYLIRKGQVHAIVRMRSNDSLSGYKNDKQWQQHVLNKVADELDLPAGNIYWNAGSLHIYARHYYLVDHFAKTGNIHITKTQYNELYPDSPFKEF